MQNNTYYRARSRWTKQQHGDNEMIPGVVHRYPDICLIDEENFGKPQPEDEGAVRKVIAWNGVSFFQMGSVGSTARQEGRRKKIRKGRGEINCPWTLVGVRQWTHLAVNFFRYLVTKSWLCKFHPPIWSKICLIIYITLGQFHLLESFSILSLP